MLAAAGPRGWLDDTDVFFTTDHGEMQGDFGLLYKGPFHVDALHARSRPVLAHRPPSAGAVDAPAVVTDPWARSTWRPTFCAIAGIEPADWMQGAAAADRRRHARPRAGAVRVGQPVPRLRHAPPLDLPRRLALHRVRAVDRREAQRSREALRRRRPAARVGRVRGDPSRARRVEIATGELYRVTDDPWQWQNRWDDPAVATLRDDLVDDLYGSLPSDVRHLEVVAPA